MGNNIRVDNTFYRNRQQVYPIIERGLGINLYAEDGTRYIDATCGPMTVNLGHGVPQIVDAMTRQAKKVCFAYTATFSTAPQINLGAKIMEFTPQGMSKAYFVSGGSEAVEYAIEASRQYFMEKKQFSRTKIIGRWQSYHGATFGTLSAGGATRFRQDYTPYLLNFPHIPPPYCYRCPFEKTYPSCDVFCARYLERTIQYEGPETVAAFICEPVSGSGLGAVTPPREYFPMVREICDKYGILLIADEVITGFGRVGYNFGVDYWGITPDIIVAAKGMSSGYTPLGAIILHERLVEAFGPDRKSSFFTGYTYAGNALSCAVGLAALQYIQDHNLVARSADMGQYLFARCARLAELPMVGDIRGMGLLLGIELVKDKEKKTPFEGSLGISDRVVKRAFEKGLVVRGGHGFADGRNGDLLILAPPLTTTKQEIDEIIDILATVLPEVADDLISKN